jgi:uncharacterized protein
MKTFLVAIGMLVLVQLIQAQVYPFTAIDTQFQTTTVIIPAAPFIFDTLFICGHHQVYDKKSGLTSYSKGNPDYNGIKRVNNNRYWVTVNHEISNVKNTILGDGGGQTVFRMDRVNGHWKVVNSLYGKPFINVNFMGLGGTNNNCGGGMTPTGESFSGEEFPASDNATLWANGTGYSDTSDYTIPAGNGIHSGKVLKRWQNMGWIVGSTLTNATATKKYYSMGRFSHESAVPMSDGKTVYLTDDYLPAVLFKFVADAANDYTAGQLYAYKQSETGVGGSWVTIDRQIDSLMMCREIAMRKGATIFTRCEWAVTNKNQTKLYIAETGIDSHNAKWFLQNGATRPSYFGYVDTLNGQPADSLVQDYYGRVLELNLATNTLRVLLHGGNGTDGKTNFANPDALAYSRINGREYLFISEDLNGITHNRMPAGYTHTVNEVYVLPLSVVNPTIQKLRRFLIGPNGSETSGGAFTADGLTMLLNIQHPSGSNVFPFNHPTTIAISGFEQYVANLFEEPNFALSADSIQPFQIYPNPSSRMVHFNYTSSVMVFNVAGALVLKEENTDKIDISTFVPGVYFLQTIDGQVVRLVVE